MLRVAPFVKIAQVWTTTDFLEFLGALPIEGLLVIQKSLEIVAPDADIKVLKSRAVTIQEINQASCEQSSWFGYCRDPAHFDYHALVVASGERAGIDPKTLVGISTFKAERIFMEKILKDVGAYFATKWERMSTEERMKVLKRADPDGALKNKAELINASAKTVFSAYRPVTRTTGFSADLLATSSLVGALAAGFTVPMPGYLRMTTAMSSIAGWQARAILILVDLAIYAWENRPNVRTTSAMIMTMHAIKMDALKAGDLGESS